MRTFLWLIVMISGLVLFGCDSKEQPKQQAEAVTTQSAKVAETPKAETTPSTAPVTESTPAVPDVMPAKAEQTPTMAETAMVEAVKPATAEAAVKTPAKVAVPQEIILQASYGNITFPHGMHAEAHECSICHGEGTPAAFGITKEIAHKLCKDCHKEQGSGPTACTGCHKK